MQYLYSSDNQVILNNQPLIWPGIKSISLQDCKLGHFHLRVLLMICPSLVSLELKSSTGMQLKHLDEQGKMLREHGRHLQYLTYDAGSSGSSTNDVGDTVGYKIMRGALFGMGSLSPLTNLKTLVITPWTTLGPSDLTGLPFRAAHPVEEDGRHLVKLIPKPLQKLTILPRATPRLKVDVNNEVDLLRMDGRFAELEIEIV